EQTEQFSQSLPVSQEQAGRSRDESADIVKSTKRRAGDQKALVTLNKRIADESQLADVYGKWISVVAAKQRTVLHSGMTGVVIILGMLLVGLFFDGWLVHLLGN